jgi:hypothetical protein
MTPKPWQTSRTLIVNAALTLVFALGLVGQLAGAFAIDPRYVALAGAAAAIVNFWLRLDTTAPIAGTPAATAALAEPVPPH